jgi:hypothetical protein
MNRYVRRALGSSLDPTDALMFLAFSASLSGGELGSEIGNQDSSFSDSAFGWPSITTRWTHRAACAIAARSATVDERPAPDSMGWSGQDCTGA